MQRPTKTSKNHAGSGRGRVFHASRAGVLMAALLTAGVVTAIARYESRGSDPKTQATQTAQAKQGSVANLPGNNYVTVEVAGKKLQLNAQTLQQGPLTQEQAQQIAGALKENQSTEGLVQVQHPDGTVSMDLQGRFQNVMLAKKSDDGSVSQACVDNSEAAAAFLRSKESTTQPAWQRGRKAVVKE
jgi:hypothetical protein